MQEPQSRFAVERIDRTRNDREVGRLAMEYKRSGQIVRSAKIYLLNKKLTSDSSVLIPFS